MSNNSLSSISLKYVFLLLATQTFLASCDMERNNHQTAQSYIDQLVVESGNTPSNKRSEAIHEILSPSFPLEELVASFDDSRPTQPLIAMKGGQYTVGDLCHYLFLVRMKVQIDPTDIYMADTSKIPPDLETRASTANWWEKHKHEDMDSHRVKFLHWQIDGLNDSVLDARHVEALREYKLAQLEEVTSRKTQ